MSNYASVFKAKKIAMFVAVVFVFLSLTVAGIRLTTPPIWSKQSLDFACKFILCVWIVLPPIYFTYEYNELFIPEYIKERRQGELEEFKYAQDLASKIWLAVITMLLGLYFGKDFHIGP